MDAEFLLFAPLSQWVLLEPLGKQSLSGPFKEHQHGVALLLMKKEVYYIVSTISTQTPIFHNSL